jgi:hypothetical protein
MYAVPAHASRIIAGQRFHVNPLSQPRLPPSSVSSATPAGAAVPECACRDRSASPNGAVYSRCLTARAVRCLVRGSAVGGLVGHGCEFVPQLAGRCLLRSSGCSEQMFRPGPPIVPERAASEHSWACGCEPDGGVGSLLWSAQHRTYQAAEGRQGGGEAGSIGPPWVHAVEGDVRWRYAPCPLCAECDLGAFRAGVGGYCAVAVRVHRRQRADERLAVHAT